jgi:hypothetical protein
MPARLLISLPTSKLHNTIDPTGKSVIVPNRQMRQRGLQQSYGKEMKQICAVVATLVGLAIISPGCRTSYPDPVGKVQLRRLKTKANEVYAFKLWPPWNPTAADVYVVDLDEGESVVGGNRIAHRAKKGNAGGYRVVTERTKLSAERATAIRKLFLELNLTGLLISDLKKWL